MKKILLIIGVFLTVLTLSLAYAGNVSRFAGEKVFFDIKKFGVKAGEAELNFNGLVEFEGRKLVYIRFQASALNFLDEEKIFLDPETLLPFIVERDLNIWGKKEKIREEYFHQKGTVEITKTIGDKVEKITLEPGYAVDNVYAFIYRYRTSGSFKTGEQLTMNLPTKQVALAMKENTRVKTVEKEYNAYFMQSDPREYNIWFDASARRIPLRIDGALGLGKTAMIMRSYEAPPAVSK